MMGRIPLLINTHCVFPFSDKFNIESIALVINEEELDGLEENIYFKLPAELR